METKLYTESEIDKLVDDLKAGHVVAIATDTVMGLAVRADLESAFKKLKKIKSRSETKPLPVMVADTKQLEKIVELNNRDKKLVNEFLPGAITFVFNKKPSAKIIGGYKTLAVRIPDDNILKNVVSKLNVPIFLTSANKSNQPTTKKYLEVLEIFNNEIKSILKRDALGYKASTIIDASSSKLEVLREGNIGIKEILESLEE